MSRESATVSDLDRSDSACVSTVIRATKAEFGARLSAEESLAVFRTVLSAVSRPGTLVGLPRNVAPGVPAVIVPALALADLDVSVSTIDDDAERVNEATWLNLIRAVTGCRHASASDADIVIARRAPSAGDIAGLRAGTASAPEHGARLFLACRTLATGHIAGATTIRVSGPGASSGRVFSVAGLGVPSVGRGVFSSLAAVNESFPAGIDTWLVADDGVVAGLPRSAHIEIVEPATGET